MDVMKGMKGMWSCRGVVGWLGRTLHSLYIYCRDFINYVKCKPSDLYLLIIGRWLLIIASEI